MNTEQKKAHHPLLWVVTNFLAMGIPFSLVIWVSTTLFKDLGHSDTEITVATSSIVVVWSLKPFWAGFLDMFKTKKFFVLSMEFVMGILFVLMGLALQMPGYFGLIIGLMWLVAFASATQDICSDGIYISTLSKEQQATYIGVQGMAWNVGRIVAVSVVVAVADGLQENQCMTAKNAWMYALFGAGGLMALFGLYHTIFLPTGSVPDEQKKQSAKEILGDFLTSAADFCNKRALWGMLAFVFFYRSAEGLLLVEAPLYMQGCMEDGALQLSLTHKAAIDGTVSTLVSIAGGLLGGFFIAKFSLKRTLFILALCINVPNGCYVYLSQVVTPDNPLSVGEIATIISLEKFWYGFGFVGNMLYMMQQIAPGKFKMTHYAIATAFMNLVLAPTQMASGPLADTFGFQEFFWLVMAAAIPSLIAAWYAPFPQLGRKGDTPVDDDSLLDDDDRKVQGAARKATILALLSAMVFLFLDVLSLGWMSGTDSGYWLAFFLGLMGLTTIVKLGLAAKALVAARVALDLAASLGTTSGSRSSGGKAYVSNAKGARIGGIVMIAVSLLLVWFGMVRIANGTDWNCAFGPNAKTCLHPDAKPLKECRVRRIERSMPAWMAENASEKKPCANPDVK